MDLSKYLAVLVVLCLEGGETGGGGKHHDHVKLHIPEFHHHSHHKKVITIHHHHHQPKKEQHHHHHHHHKPPMPHEHHYSQHHKKVHLKTKTVTKGTDHHHGSHGHHHKHHSHHHSHEDSSHEAPVQFSYKPNAIPSYKDDFSSSHSPSNPSYHIAPKVPHVHGIAHTVKQVKVYDSLPGALPNNGNAHGYEVTEETDDADDAFLSMRNLQSRYPQTFGYVQGLSSQPTYDPFASISSQNSLQENHDLFEASPTAHADGIESFAGTIQNEPFSSSALNQNEGLPGVSPSGEFPITFPESGFDGQVNSFTGADTEGPSFIAHEENPISAETPVTFDREAGIQQTTNTGNVETIVY